MIRKIIQIDAEKCNGCGACAKACHEGAIAMINGKAQLIRDDYCDGFGDCLPACPTNAISFVEREAAAYDEAAVLKNKAQKQQQTQTPFVCPGMRVKQIQKADTENMDCSAVPPRLQQWPVQIKLVSPHAPYFQNADLLIAADCTAYAYGNFHNSFIRNRITLVGCPKLDSIDYSEKLGAIISLNSIKSILLVRMEVPCCGGMETAVQKAVCQSGKNIPLQTVIISTDGQILKE